MAFQKLLILSILVTISKATFNLKLVKEWKELDFSFPDDFERTDAINSRNYIRGNSIPIDVDVYYGSNSNPKIFVTIPRFDIGRPYTLTTWKSGSDQLFPYPDFTWQNIRGSDCGGITSVFRVAIDECSRLWVLDTGKIGDSQVCPPKLLVFDLRTDRLIRKHVFPRIMYVQTSIFVTPVVDVRDPHTSCSDTFVYIADVTGFGIVVYDYRNDKAWRIDNKLFYPHPPHGTFTVAGESFDLMDGVLGMSLSPFTSKYEDRTLYFHALASITENYVKTSVIRNSTLWENNAGGANPRDFKEFPNPRSSQSAPEAMDRNGIMFYGLITPMAIACWNSNTDYKSRNMDIVARDSQMLQFPSGMKIVNNLKGEQELWILTCRFQKVMTGTITTDELNFRILAGKVKDLVKGTKCAHPNGLTQSDQVPDSRTNTGFSTYLNVSSN